MKKYFVPLATVLLLSGIHCKKDRMAGQPGPSVPLDDAKNILLKEINVQSSPSPYFHFTYDNKNYVTQINFASGFSIYNVEYENKRVKKMTNIQNNNSLVYSYSQNRVSEINEFSGQTNEKRFTYKFSYNTINLLTEINWIEFLTNSTGIIYKKALLTYRADSNLASIDLYYNTTGTLDWIKKDSYSQYDNKTNVDDFYLMKDFVESYLFLPQVKFQRNNPLKQHTSSVQNDYEITNSFDYQNNLPVKRTSTMIQTRGSGSGQSLQSSSVYSYY